MQHPPIPLSKPDISELERSYVQEVMASSRLAMGPMIAKFEQRMATLCNTKHAIAVSSGTAALHLIVRGTGIGAGDEVITTPFSFVASSNCVLYEGATPRFVDIDPQSLAIDPDRIESAITPATKGLLAVDVFGQPANWPRLKEIADKHGLILIDDACEAPGAEIEGIQIGAWGRAAAFGFYPNKQITTGEGGCITTNDDVLTDLCRSMSNQGRFVTHKMDHVRLGYNYRMNELSAAVGCAQLERLPELLANRQRVADLYADALTPLRSDIHVPQPLPGSTRSWFVYVIQLADHYGREARDTALKLLQEQGIGCAPYFPSIHLQSFYRDTFGYKEGDFPICESISNRSIALPFFTTLSADEVSRVAEVLASVLPQLTRKERTIHT